MPVAPSSAAVYVVRASYAAGCQYRIRAEITGPSLAMPLRYGK